MYTDRKKSFAPSWINGTVFAITFLGLFQIIGEFFGLPLIKGIGAASMISPFPKVFCDVKGLETFASSFTLICHLEDGSIWKQQITPQLYQKLEGPYNRRNVYGAALSYAPRLPEKVWSTVFCYGLREGGALRKEFQLPANIKSVEVEIKTNTRHRQDKWVLSPNCESLQK